MRCILPAVNLKNFGKAVHCLAKIGHEIYLEFVESGVLLKTVNSSRSSYMCFRFLKSNFSFYDWSYDATEVDNNTDTCNNNDNDGFFRCKVAVKTILQVFKSLNTMDKSVEQCTIFMDDGGSDDETSGCCKLIFQLKCRHGILKTHHINYQECDSLHAKLAKDLYPNVLKCDHKLLSDAASNFHSSLEEISLQVTPCKVVLRSVPADDENITHSMKTEMQLGPDEFQDFQVGVDTEVTFCLKDVRAILAFCEVASCPLEMSFEQGGKPLVVKCAEDRLFDATFVLATISHQRHHQQRRHSNNSTTTTNNHASMMINSKTSNNNTTLKQRSTTKTPSKDQPQEPPPLPAEEPAAVEESLPPPPERVYNSVIDTFYLPHHLNYSQVHRDVTRRVIAPNSDYSDSSDDGT